jgi:hypothetical protein
MKPWRSALAASLLGSAACHTGQPASAGAGAHSAYIVWLEPPLSAPAAAALEHESGYSWRGVASATSVRFQAPEGPCTLTLSRRGEVIAETSLKLARGGAEVDWLRLR